ncbi:MAG: GNAT family N-acetyltransferase [Armatimonadetes bacterium]|nr:GNAT family N-acetyltransferase [Armatimonadota bacterium]
MLTIVGARVNLREFHVGDARWLVRAMARGSWWRWDAPWEGRPSADDLRRVPVHLDVLIRERASPPRRIVIETRRGVPIGTASRYWVDERTQWMEVGIGIYQARHWGKGYGFEALGLWVDHLFEIMPLRRIGLRTWSGNHRMIRLARRLGFRQEAAFREAYAGGSRVYDRLAFGLLRREWERVRRSWAV